MDGYITRRGGGGLKINGIKSDAFVYENGIVNSGDPVQISDVIGELALRQDFDYAAYGSSKSIVKTVELCDGQYVSVSRSGATGGEVTISSIKMYPDSTTRKVDTVYCSGVTQAVYDIHRLSDAKAIVFCLLYTTTIIKEVAIVTVNEDGSVVVVPYELDITSPAKSVIDPVGRERPAFGEVEENLFLLCVPSATYTPKEIKGLLLRYDPTSDTIVQGVYTLLYKDSGYPNAYSDLSLSLNNCIVSVRRGTVAVSFGCSGASSASTSYPYPMRGWVLVVDYDSTTLELTLDKGATQFLTRSGGCTFGTSEIIPLDEENSIFFHVFTGDYGTSENSYGTAFTISETNEITKGTSTTLSLSRCKSPKILKNNARNFWIVSAYGSSPYKAQYTNVSVSNLVVTVNARYTSSVAAYFLTMSRDWLLRDNIWAEKSGSSPYSWFIGIGEYSDTVQYSGRAACIVEIDFDADNATVSERLLKTDVGGATIGRGEYSCRYVLAKRHDETNVDMIIERFTGSSALWVKVRLVIARFVAAGVTPVNGIATQSGGSLEKIQTIMFQ